MPMIATSGRARLAAAGRPAWRPSRPAAPAAQARRRRCGQANDPAHQNPPATSDDQRQTAPNQQSHRQESHRHASHRHGQVPLCRLGPNYRSAHLAEMTKIWYFLPMHHVAFVVYPGFELLDISGPAAVFNGANHALRQSGKAPFYTVDLVSAQGGLVTSSSGVAVHSLRRSDFVQLASKPVDTLLVAGAQREQLLRAVADPGLRAWLPQLAAKAPRFGSVCSGAFILARSGCSTAVASRPIGTPAARLPARFPRSRWIPTRSMSLTAGSGLPPG